MTEGKAVRILTTSWRYRTIVLLNRPFDHLPIRGMPQTSCGVWLNSIGPYILAYAVPLTAIVFLITIWKGTLAGVMIALLMTPGILLMYVLLLVGLADLADATSRWWLPALRYICAPLRPGWRIIRSTLCKPVVYLTPV